MIRPGSKDSQNYDNNNQRVHPQPIDENMNQNGNSMDDMIGRIFNNISSYDRDDKDPCGFISSYDSSMFTLTRSIQFYITVFNVGNTLYNLF
jgi:hypothetical protein